MLQNKWMMLSMKRSLRMHATGFIHGIALVLPIQMIIHGGLQLPKHSVMHAYSIPLVCWMQHSQQKHQLSSNQSLLSWMLLQKFPVTATFLSCWSCPCLWPGQTLCLRIHVTTYCYGWTKSNPKLDLVIHCPILFLDLFGRLVETSLKRNTLISLGCNS